jgi:hypothetical protein
MGPVPPELKPEHWATVKIPWREGALLLTLGTGWRDCPSAMEGLPARSAALHRVHDACGWGQDRHSLPFFLDAVPMSNATDEPVSTVATEPCGGEVEPEYR